MKRDERGIEEITGELLRVFETGDFPDDWDGGRIAYLTYGLGLMAGKLLALAGKTGELAECLKSFQDGTLAAIHASTVQNGELVREGG